MRHAPWIAFAASLAVLAGLLALWWTPQPDGANPVAPTEGHPAVVVHTAAALRPAVETAAAAFQADTDIKIELRFGPSEGLLSNLQVTGQGDLFLPADDSYVAKARAADLVEQDYAFATLTAVAVLRADYPQAA